MSIMDNFQYFWGINKESLRPNLYFVFFLMLLINLRIMSYLESLEMRKKLMLMFQRGNTWLTNIFCLLKTKQLLFFFLISSPSFYILLWIEETKPSSTWTWISLGAFSISYHHMQQCSQTCCHYRARSLFIWQ